jgi:hypothetical protein
VPLLWACLVGRIHLRKITPPGIPMNVRHCSRLLNTLQVRRIISERMAYFLYALFP